MNNMVNMVCKKTWATTIKNCTHLVLARHHNIGPKDLNDHEINEHLATNIKRLKEDHTHECVDHMIMNTTTIVVITMGANVRNNNQVYRSSLELHLLYLLPLVAQP
jgi:hypothetical protein